MDIVHWLRNEVQMVFLRGEPNRLHEAADEIERLRLALGAIISAYDHAWDAEDAVMRCRKIMADGQKPWEEIERLRGILLQIKQLSNQGEIRKTAHQTILQKDSE